MQKILFTKQKQTHRSLTQTKGYRRGTVVGGTNEEFEIYIQMLLDAKELTNKDLLYTMRNSSQYCVILYVGEKKSKKNICVYISTESRCSTPERQHYYKSTLFQ